MIKIRKLLRQRSRFIPRHLLFGVVILSLALNAFAFNIEGFLQTRRITGKVTNSNGEALSGVTVNIKGRSQSVVSDQNGTFTIESPGNYATLVFSYVGMETFETIVRDDRPLSIALRTAETSLSDVVVVGYATQKKINLTGSVASVSSNTLLQRPATNATNLLQGRVAGLQVTQPTGQPGKDDGIFQIRGLGSFGASSSPLIIVDGLIGSLSILSPNDIENITVLKDAASASIYGSRAANGVILVTTKKGSRGSVIEYKFDAGLHRATRLPEFVTNSAEYMTMFNSARARSGLTAMYTQDQIDAYKNATDRNQFPNFDWVDYYFKQASALNHYVSVSGGNEKTAYKLSLSYLNQDGILPNVNLKRYNALVNVDSRVTDAIKVGAIINMGYKDIHEPPGFSETALLGIYQAGPLYGPFLPDGSGRKSSRAYSFEPHNTTSPVMFSNGERLTDNYNINAQAYADINILKNLKWTTRMGVNYNDNTIKDHIYATQEHYFYQKLPGAADYTLDAAIVSPGAVGVTDNYNKSILPSISSTLTYDTRIGTNHNLTAMVGYEQQSYHYQYLSGSKKVFPTNSLDQLDAGSTDGQAVGGSANEWALRSFFGRANYDYKGKYLLEANARYDGTSRVSESNRWGVFPSVSAGWRVSEERFFRNNVTWMNNLKIRGSYGVLGNQEIGNYPYQDILNLTGYPYTTSVEQGVILTRMTDKNLKWESTKVLDLGVDVDLFKGLFGITADWFRKNTFDILTAQPVPGSLGLTGPITNDGKLQNVGLEVELRHQNEIGQFTYGATLLFTTYKNKLLSIRTASKGINEVGLPYNSYYLYEWIGIFQSQEEIEKSPKQVLFAPKPGDLKMKDQNGDGVVNASDRVSYSPNPDYTYSFNVYGGWKGFNLSIFLQGVQGQKTRIYGWGWEPFVQGDPPLKIFENAWTPTNHSNTVPAVYLGSGDNSSGYGGVKTYGSTYQLQDASYLRIKNINLSYILPKALTSRIRSKDITVYVSADNLVTFTKYPGADPERASVGSSGGRGSIYPQVRILNAGINFKF